MAKGIKLSKEERLRRAEAENRMLREQLAAEKAKVEYIACMNYPEILDDEEEEANDEPADL